MQNSIYPKKLKAGDTIRVIAPSMTMAILDDETRAIADKRLADLEINVEFGEHVLESDLFNSSSIESRIADLHAAFEDKNVAGILTVIGGYNSNQLLSHIDYDVVKTNPKVFCGYSDITALSNAIYTKTGLVTYSGLHYSSFGMKNGFEYSEKYFKHCLMEDEPIEYIPAESWSDDEWYMDQDKRVYIANNGFEIINPGHATGKILGGNLCTLNLLQGTEFFPSLDDCILFLEDDYLVDAQTFDRDLQSLVHQQNFSKVQAIVIGRFQKKSNVSLEALHAIFKSKKELANLPIVANTDFGHTTPSFTFPIGGHATLIADEERISIICDRH